MDQETLDFVRTSIRKNPEEWLFEEETESANQVPSVLNVFKHKPTQYKLLIIYVPEVEIPGVISTEESHYINLVEPKEYEKKVKESDGVFVPQIEQFSFVHEKSVIIKTLFYLKNVSKEDESIIKYEKFRSHVNKKIQERKPVNG